MRGFRERVSVERALAAALEGLAPRRTEVVPLDAAAGRVLAEDVVSAVDVPGFDRAAMDGYAIPAAAANAYDPTPFRPLRLPLAGESMPGAPAGGATGSAAA